MPKPSLLGLLAAVHAKQSPPEDMPSDDDDDRPSKHGARAGVEAAQSFIDACDDDDPEALASAFGAFLDLHHASDAQPPKDDTKPAGSKPVLTLHILRDPLVFRCGCGALREA